MPEAEASPPRDPSQTGGLPVFARLFGSILVEVGDRRLGPRDFGGVKSKQILEALLLARGHSVPKDRLADFLWGDDLPQNVSATIETYVSVLRRQLGVEIGRQLVVTEPEAYRFAIESARFDLDLFDKAVENAARAEEPAERRHFLEEALALVRGEVLEDEPYATWAERVRDVYRQRVVQIRLDAAETALIEGDFNRASTHAEAALELDMWDERAYRAVMLASYLLGRRHQALRVYERCRQVLADDLGVEPLAETEALHAAIRRREDPTGLLPAVAARGPISAGTRADVLRHKWDRDVEILLVEDNPADVRLIQEALGEGKVPYQLHVTEDGEEALTFLRQEGSYADEPRPDLVLLDLNLPRKDGRDVLKEVKSDPDLHRIPVIVLTTSSAEQDILRCYDLHANSYITKPTDLDSFLQVIRSIEEFWPATASLPPS